MFLHYRWKLVHAAIDEYSRLPVFCQCSNNNKAETVLAVQIYGLFSSDKRGWVATYMLSHPIRGTRRASVIRGRNIQNQRIERFWRDVHASCTALFYHLFYHMEDTGIIDCDNQVQIWCLHYVYIPYINHAMSQYHAVHWGLGESFSEFNAWHDTSTDMDERNANEFQLLGLHHSRSISLGNWLCKFCIKYVQCMKSVFLFLVSDLFQSW